MWWTLWTAPVVVALAVACADSRRVTPGRGGKVDGVVAEAVLLHVSGPEVVPMSASCPVVEVAVAGGGAP